MLNKVAIWALILVTGRTERSGVRIPVGSRDSFSETSRPATGPYPTAVLPREQSDWGLKLTTHLYLELNEELYFCFCMPACSGKGIYLYLYWHLFHRQLRTQNNHFTPTYRPPNEDPNQSRYDTHTKWKVQKQAQITSRKLALLLSTTIQTAGRPLN